MCSGLEGFDFSHEGVKRVVGLFTGFVSVIASASHCFLYLNQQIHDDKKEKKKKRKKRKERRKNKQTKGDRLVGRQLDNTSEAPTGIPGPPSSCMVNSRGLGADRGSCKASRTTTPKPVPGYPMNCSITRCY